MVSHDGGESGVNDMSSGEKGVRLRPATRVITTHPNKKPPIINKGSRTVSFRLFLNIFYPWINERIHKLKCQIDH